MYIIITISIYLIGCLLALALIILENDAGYEKEIFDSYKSWYYIIKTINKLNKEK